MSLERCKLLHLYIVSYTFIILFYMFNVSDLCILPPWRWSNSWPKHAGVHCVYKLILIHLYVFLYLYFTYLSFVYNIHRYC
jgi:hypothetical protein